MATIYWKGTSTDPLLQSSWSDHATSGAQMPVLPLIGILVVVFLTSQRRSSRSIVATVL